MPRNKKLWIIGGGTGFGAAIAKHYVSKGWDVIISSTNKSKLEHFIKQNDYKLANQIFDFKLINLLKEESIISTVNDILNEGPIDLLIITSAISNAHNEDFPMLQEKLSTFDKFMKINSIGYWLVVRSFFPKIINFQKSLKTIFFTSKAGWSNTNHFGFYNVSKSLLHHLSLNLHEEIRNKYTNFNFNLTILEPGEAYSEMNKGSLVDAKTIIPVIEHIENTHNINKVYFLNKEGKSLEFITQI